MRVCICAVGRMKSGPERTLVDDYLARFERTGRTLGLGPARVLEIEDRRGGGMGAEAQLLRRAFPDRAKIAVLDERGKTLSSPDLALQLADWRDTGTGEAVFAIGGANGLDPDLRRDADLRLSFGRMVWPHMLVRAMLAEQLYRAASILAGAPYHRD